MVRELETPGDSELLIRTAWVINYLTGIINNAAAQAAMMTTTPGQGLALVDLVEMDLAVLESLVESIGRMPMTVDAEFMLTAKATLDVLRLRMSEHTGTRLEAQQLQFMTEPELSKHLTKQLRFIKACETSDTVGSMLVIFGEDKVTQYGSTTDPESAPAALRELADRIERKQTVKHGPT